MSPGQSNDIGIDPEYSPFGTILSSSGRLYLDASESAEKNPGVPHVGEQDILKTSRSPPAHGSKHRQEDSDSSLLRPSILLDMLLNQLMVFNTRGETLDKPTASDASSENSTHEFRQLSVPTVTGLNEQFFEYEGEGLSGSTSHYSASTIAGPIHKIPEETKDGYYTDDVFVVETHERIMKEITYQIHHSSQCRELICVAIYNYLQTLDAEHDLLLILEDVHFQSAVQRIVQGGLLDFKEVLRMANKTSVPGPNSCVEIPDKSILVDLIFDTLEAIGVEEHLQIIVSKKAALNDLKKMEGLIIQQISEILSTSVLQVGFPKLSGKRTSVNREVGKKSKPSSFDWNEYNEIEKNKSKVAPPSKLSW